MRRLWPLALLLSITACAGLEDSVRDLNRSLYRSWSGNDTPSQRRTVSGADSGEAVPCFSSETGLLYVSQTGRCAAGFTAVPAAEAERAFGGVGRDNDNAAGSTPQRNVAAATGGAMALCYEDRQGQIFEAASCPPGSRWINSAEAVSLRDAQQAGASWCYFAGRRLLYRSRACRPGDQTLDVAQAEAMWDTLPPDRRPRQRPAQASGGTEAVPPVQAAPRGGVSATPLPPTR